MKNYESKYFNTATKMDLALISLLKKKPLEYITVSEICETAGVNRSTFYLHYETISDLLNETVRYLLNDFLSYFSADTQSIKFNLMDCELNDLIFICDKYLTPYMSYIKDNKEVFATALAHNKILGYPPDDRQYVMMYYLNGINAIVTEWLKNGCDKSIEEISEIITVCIFGRNR